MPTRSNRHIKKYNQLVAVYEPAGLETIETVTSRADEQLEQRKAEIVELREAVEGLTSADFFDEERRTEIQETESLPTPESVAASQREELIARLDAIEESLSAALADSSTLDAADDLDF
ncbi:MAG: hypothetical protein V5A32_07315 [Halovenus sp.]